MKPVRGAYHPYELAVYAGLHGNQAQGEHTVSLSLSKDTLPPVWTAKEETDACFDTCVLTSLISAVAVCPGSLWCSGRIIGLLMVFFYFFPGLQIYPIRNIVGSEFLCSRLRQT